VSGAPFVSCVLIVRCDVTPPDVVVVVTLPVVVELVVVLAVVVVEVEVEIVVVVVAVVVVAVVVLVVTVVVGVPHFKTAVRAVSAVGVMILWLFVLLVSSQ